MMQTHLDRVVGRDIQDNKKAASERGHDYRHLRHWCSMDQFPHFRLSIHSQIAKAAVNMKAAKLIHIGIATVAATI
jgi:hypothetical protein